MSDLVPDTTELLFLDVSHLEPPEPLTIILATLEQMGVTQTLTVQHRREPFPLYPLLDDLGYQHRCNKIGEDDYRIYIWRSGQQNPASLCDDERDG